MLSHDEDDEIVDSVDELACALEFFDSNDGDNTVWVTDALGRRVSVRVHALEVERLELEQTS